MKYTIQIKETSYGTVTVEASSPQEAEELAEQAYYDGNTHWKNSDMEITPNTPVRERGDAR